jgi:hypothetical protein
MSYATEGATPNLLWTAYQPSRELSHLVVLPKSTSELVVDALTCPHFDSRAGVTKNLCLFEIALVLVRLDHVAGIRDNGQRVSLRYTIVRKLDIAKPTQAGVS